MQFFLSHSIFPYYFFLDFYPRKNSWKLQNSLQFDNFFEKSILFGHLVKKRKFYKRKTAHEYFPPKRGKFTIFSKVQKFLKKHKWAWFLSFFLFGTKISTFFRFEKNFPIFSLVVIDFSPFFYFLHLAHYLF